MLRPGYRRSARKGRGPNPEALAGLLVGRAARYSEEEKDALEREVMAVVAGEAGRPDLPVVANVDFGHTDPQLILPLGAAFEIDCDARRLRLVERA